MTSVKTVKGDCEFCERSQVELKPQHGDMMCDECIARESAIMAATKVVAESRANDSAITLKADIMHAATTSFIELQGAINNNPEVADQDKKYKLALEAVERIKKLDSVIFAKEADIMNDRNERMVWIKTTQELVSTLRTDQRAKFAQFNVNYKPTATPSVPSGKTPKVKSGKTPSVRPISPASKFTNKEVAEACAKYNADQTTVKMMLLSRAAKGLTPEQAAREYAEKHADKN